ncbi:MAG: mitochondrial biogenesis AIM24-domain-containing protein [Piptocephalis tieghemiana]|nr:MAG: mitochondrial biogenesis AIM24-domain-containing protein [Piptocephalis tieghemiana]
MFPTVSVLKTARATTASRLGGDPRLLPQLYAFLTYPRSYVSLAYNRPEVSSPLPSSLGSEQAKASSEDQPQEQAHTEGLVREVEEPVDPTVGRTHLRPDISLEILNAGLGSMILAQFPQGTALKIRPGALVAHSSTAHRERVLFGPMTTTVIARLIGDPLLLDEVKVLPSASTSVSPVAQGDALIAPARMGDVALLSLGRDPSSSASALYTRRGSILARGDGVTIRATTMTGHSTGLGVGYLLRGTGPVVLSSDGGIFRLTLNPGEVYHVDANRLVAWDSMLRPRVNDQDKAKHLEPSLSSPPSWESLVSSFSSSSSSSSSSLISFLTKTWVYTRAGWSWLSTHGKVYWAWWRQHSLLKHRPLCRFEGPGDIYLSSRLPSHPSLIQSPTLSPSSSLQDSSPSPSSSSSTTSPSSSPSFSSSTLSRLQQGWFGGGGSEASIRQSTPPQPPHPKGDIRS